MREPGPAPTTSLRESLTRADYTAGGVSALLGDAAHRALLRNETTPALRHTGDGSALGKLNRLFALQVPVTVDAVAATMTGGSSATSPPGWTDGDLP
ncbi:MAG: DUF7059 domain-containing protein [Nocardioidaceae bacterium]